MRIVLAGDYPKNTLEELQNLLPHHSVVPVTDNDEYLKMTDADCIIVRVFKTPAEVIRNNKNLKAILRWGAGFDTVDIKEAGINNVMVSNTPGVNAYAVAELALGLMIITGRKIINYHQNILEGNWDRNAFSSINSTLNGKKVGVIGAGSIGIKVAERVQCFGAKVQYFDSRRLLPQDEDAYHMEYMKLDDLIVESDIISLHVPLLEKTYHLIDDEQFSNMKKNCLIINTARGGLINDEALLKAVDRGSIGGAGLDCVEDENSEITQKLFKHKNIVITPHIGGTSNDLGDAMVPFIANQIEEFDTTGRLPNLVNEEYLKLKWGEGDVQS